MLLWNPWTLLDPGFQLSFAAVGAIFLVAPRLRRLLDGYPLPRGTREPIALSAVCGAATAPISWFHFHQIPLLTIPANVAAAPVVAPMLALALLAALSCRRSGPSLAHVNGLLAAYLAGCARFFGGLPGAQVTSASGAAALGAGALLVLPMLGVVASELKPVYLLTGSDRPKIARAVRRLRDRFGDDATEHLSAQSRAPPT